MRRVLYTMIATITLSVAVVLALLLSPTTPVINAPHAAPTPTTTMAQCATEDGAGQALCMWQGTVSGDCAPSVVGDAYVSSVCVRVHSLGMVHTTNPDGGSSTSYGPDMVSECIDIMQQGRMDDETLTILEGEGWTILQCFRAQLSE